GRAQVKLSREIGQRLAVEEGEQGGLPGIASRAVECFRHGQLIRRYSDSWCCRKGALSRFEHHGIGQNNDLGLHNSACGDEIILDVTERSAHPVLRRNERKLIAGLKGEATQRNKLQGAAESHMPIDGKRIVLARG